MSDAEVKRTIERLYDEKDAMRRRAERAEAAVGRMHEWLVSIEGAIIAPETIRPVLNALYDQTREALESAGREGAEPTGAHNPGSAGSTPAPATKQRSFEIDECPECRSRTRSFHDMLWVGKWRGCLNPWHDSPT